MKTKFSHTIIFETNSTDHDTIQDAIKELIGISQNNPDLFELKIQNKQSIGIKEVKELIKWLQFKPFALEQKLAVIYKAEKLTTQAQNSLLKTLEEPPKHSFIFLVTLNHKTLLNTIISRSEVIRLVSDHQKASQAEALPSSLKEQLKLIDETTKIKDINERRNKIQDIISAAHTEVQNSEEGKLEKLLLIEQTQKAFNRNVNQKLLLENLLFNL